MTRGKLRALLGTVALFASGAACAATVNLFEYAFNVDGVLSDSLASDPIPSQVNLGGFNSSTGLGTVIITTTGAGSHYAGLFIDPEIDQTINTFFNEVGTTVGAPAAGQSWEIDEPGYVFGDIFARFTGGILDNKVGTTSPDDVSLAMAWNLVLTAGQTATTTFLIGTLPPVGGFYLVQNDPASSYSIYMSSTLTIAGGPVDPGPVPVPEPGTLSLLSLALFATWGSQRKMMVRGARTAP